MESCVSCQRSLNRIGGARRRSMALTAQLMQQHPCLMAFCSHVINIHQFNGNERICRPCFQRAQRYVPRDQPGAIEQDQLPGDIEQDQLPGDIEQDQLQHDTEDQPAEARESDSFQEGNIEESELNQPDLSVHGNMQDQQVQVNRPQMIEIPGYTRAPFNSQLCIFVDCTNTNLQRIRVDIRTVVLQEKSFYLPRGTRVCGEHADSGWQDIDLRTRRVISSFSTKQVKDMMDLLRKRRLFLDFEKLSSMTNVVFNFYIGFSKENFLQILQATPSITSHHKKAKTALATVLAKLHTGESNQRLSTIFKMSRKTFEKVMRDVRQELMAEFVPQNLGYDHITREEVISRCLTIPNFLFGNPNAPLSLRKAIIILDGTYIYLQKSSNYYFQRKSYSLHKFRHLVKPFLVVCPDGHIVDVYGLYEATISDARILSQIMTSQTDPFHWYFHENDVLILDRGFRDCIEEVESYGYTTYMPSSKDANETQLSVRQANDSRKVTLCRWVVETVNGRLKNQFRQLRHQFFNLAAPHLLEEIKIAAALLNAYGVPLTDHRLVNEIIDKIARSDDDRNRLSEYVLENNLNRRWARFESIDAASLGLNEFPILSMDELIIYALGTYQILQARSYYGEHIKNGSYIIEIYKEPHLEDFRTQNLDYNDPWLLRGRIQSRHVNNRVYYVYILVEREIQGIDAILGHYCSCIVGKRTLGCCSHIMSIIWFLGWGRYQDDLSPPAQFLDIIIRHDQENERYDDRESD